MRRRCRLHFAEDDDFIAGLHVIDVCRINPFRARVGYIERCAERTAERRRGAARVIIECFVERNANSASAAVGQHTDHLRVFAWAEDQRVDERRVRNCCGECAQLFAIDGPEGRDHVAGDDDGAVRILARGGGDVSQHRGEIGAAEEEALAEETLGFARHLGRAAAAERRHFLIEGDQLNVVVGWQGGEERLNRADAMDRTFGG